MLRGHRGKEEASLLRQRTWAALQCPQVAARGHSALGRSASGGLGLLVCLSAYVSMCVCMCVCMLA